jgi:hypothetical protein
MRKADVDGSIILTLITNADKLVNDKTELSFCAYILNKHPQICSILLNVNKKDSNWLTIDDFIESDITEPKEQEIIIEPLIPQKPFNGDLSTDVLASTEDELLSSPLIVITEDLVKNMSADDRLREKYRMDNFKRVLLRSLNKVEKGSEKRKEIIHKITVAESNLSAILKYS